MFLSKKDTPKQYQGMWYAGVFNILIGTINAFIYYMGGTWVTLMSACFSIIVAIVIFTMIKRFATQMLWDSLTRGSGNSGMTGEDGQCP